MFVVRDFIIMTHLLCLDSLHVENTSLLVCAPPVLSQDLSAALKGALSGSLEALMLGLMKSTAQYDASELKASMKVSSGGTTAVVEHYLMMTSLSYNI